MKPKELSQHRLSSPWEPELLWMAAEIPVPQPGHAGCAQHPRTARLHGNHRASRAALASLPGLSWHHMAGLSWNKVPQVFHAAPQGPCPHLLTGGMDLARPMQAQGTRQDPACSRVCGMAALLSPCQASWAAQGAFGSNGCFSVGAAR